MKHIYICDYINKINNNIYIYIYISKDIKYDCATHDPVLHT